jgi:hypothetical protein
VPYEPSSRAGLLSASHVFVVEVVGFRPGLSAVRQNGTPTTDMALQIVCGLKGRLAQREGEIFFSALRMPSGTRKNRFDGLWPHAHPWLGGRYVVVAQGPDPVRALAGARGCRAVLPPSHEADVRAVAEAQAAFARTTRKTSLADADLIACSELVSFAGARTHTLHRPFGAYLFARLAAPLLRAYRASPRPPATGPLMAAVFALLSHPDATPDLRAQILEDITRLAATAASRALARDVGRALLHELIAGRGERSRLVHDAIYPVLFDTRGHPRLCSWEVVTDPQRLTLATQTLRTISGERARRIAEWISEPGRAPC